MGTKQTLKIDNRENILNHALHLFYSKGYDRVGVQEIVEAAGITKPTLYYYFKSKYGLLESLLEERCTKLNKAIEKAIEKENGITAKLYSVTRECLTMASENKEFFFFIVSLFYSARENETYLAIKPYLVQLFKLISNIFYQSVNELGNMNGRQEQFAIGFIGTLIQYVVIYYERRDSKEELNSNEVVHSLVHQFMHGIYS